jgi:[ribosomal protein S18]-alanine N-acetyltransferase
LSEASGVDLTVGDFRSEHAETILDWVRSAEDALAWAEVPFLRVGPPVLAAWHAEPEIVPCVAWLHGELCAYGQVWEDQTEREAEVTRVIVAPELRGRGVGRSFARSLATEATRRGFGVVLARTTRPNRAAFACFRAAGFARMDRADEVAMNVDQSEDYVWLQFMPEGTASSTDR